MRLAVQNIPQIADPSALPPDIGAFYSSPAGIFDPTTLNTMGMTYTTSNKAAATSYNAAAIAK